MASGRVPKTNITFFIVFIAIFTSIFPNIATNQKLRKVNHSYYAFILSILSIESAKYVSYQAFLYLSNDDIHHFTTDVIRVIHFIKEQCAHL